METKTESKAEKKNVIERIKDRLDERKDIGVEVDGFAISPATAKLLREREGSEFIGASFVQLCREVKGTIPGPWIPFRPDLHAHCERKAILQEWIKSPAGLNGFDEIWLSQNGEEPVVVGHKIALSVLQRMQSNHALTPAGERLLTEQIGEESAAEVSTTK